MPQILVIDDDAALRGAICRLLASDGHEVVQVGDIPNLDAALRGSRFDAILADLGVPPLGALDVVRLVRAADALVPIVVMTGAPTMESAIDSFEHGVYRYLQKPFDPAAMREVVGRVARFHALSRVGDRTTNSQTTTVDLDSRVKSAITQIWLAVQPIVDVCTGQAIAYEALLRCDQPGFASPEVLLNAALEVGRFRDLTRAINGGAAALAARLPPNTRLFVNLHPSELLDDHLLDPSLGLVQYAHDVVLEVTERASLPESDELTLRLAALRTAGFRLAIDDLGTGYSGLTSITHIQPEVVKLDMSLTRGIGDNATKRTVVRSMVELCSQLGLQLVAEGVETVAELSTLRDAGVTLMQGYYFARPARTFTVPMPAPTPRATENRRST